MIAALSLVLLAAPGVGGPSSKLDEAIARSNRLWYDLPEATTSITFGSSEGTTVFREARRGRMVHNTVRLPTGVSSEAFDDGKRATVLSFGPKTYSDAPSGSRTPFEELPPLVEQRFDMRFESAHGIVLRANPPFSITRDERAVRVGTETYRRLTGRHRQRRTKDQEAQAIEFRVLIDRAGLIRRAEGTAESDSNGKVSFLFLCDPKAPTDEPFTYDVSVLKGWTKIES